MERKSNYSNKTSSLSLTMSTKVLEQVNDMVKNHREYGSRSDFAEKAIEFYMDSGECPYCHERTSSGRFCSHCGRNITFSPAERSLAQDMYLRMHPEHKSTEDIVAILKLSDAEIVRILNDDIIPPTTNVKFCKRADLTKQILDMYAKKRDYNPNEVKEFEELTDEEILEIDNF